MQHPGPRSRTMRESAKVGVRALAREMGISAPYLIDLERGFRRFTDEMQTRHEQALTRLTNKQPNAGLARR